MSWLKFSIVLSTGVLLVGLSSTGRPVGRRPTAPRPRFRLGQRPGRVPRPGPASGRSTPAAAAPRRCE